MSHAGLKQFLWSNLVYNEELGRYEVGLPGNRLEVEIEDSPVMVESLYLPSLKDASQANVFVVSLSDGSKRTIDDPELVFKSDKSTYYLKCEFLGQPVLAKLSSKVIQYLMPYIEENLGAADSPNLFGDKAKQKDSSGYFLRIDSWVVPIEVI